MAEARRALRRLVARLAEFWAGANGDYAFEAYRGHLARHHPERPLPSRAEYEALRCRTEHNRIRRCC